MFVFRNVPRTNKTLTNYICTSSVIKCDKLEKANVKSEKPLNKIENKEAAAKKKSATFDSIIGILKSEQPEKTLRPLTKKKSQHVKPKTTFDLFEPALKSSAKKVAEEFGGDKKMCSELLEHIKDFEVKDSEKYSSVFEPEKEMWDEIASPFQSFQGKSLNIFNKSIMQETENQVNLKIWNDLEAEELAYQAKISPQNYFQELIEWTKDGKLWHFPIDNEQGMEEEAQTSFTEHIFLEQYLEPWCPKKGPLRNFMALVLIGLSKNPYLGVAQKKEHIEWFRNYFDNKKKLLQELGAMGHPKEINSQQNNKA